MSTIVDARPRGPSIPADCPQCRTQLDYTIPPTFIGTLRVRCSQCKSLFTHPQPKPNSTPGTNSPNANAGNSRSSNTRTGFGGGAGGSKIGTDRNPIDMAYYNVLGLDSQCTLEEVKKAYRRLAIKLHPDKNRDDPDAEEKFKEISIAYQVLSDPDLRHKYNEFGQKNGGGAAEPAGGFQDPEEVFGKMFGGDRFEDLIGQISIGKDMKDAFQQQAEQEDEMMIGPGGRPMLTPDAMQKKMARDRAKAEVKAMVRKQRVDKLAEHLTSKLAVFVEAARNPEDREVGQSFKEKCRLEAEELKEESYGVDLLNAIGRAYQAKSQQHMASSQFAPLGWFHGAKNTFNTVSDTVSTLRSAIELKQVFDRLQAAEGQGISPENMRKLEEQAAEQGMKTMWKGVKLEVESVVREAAERVLSEPNVTKEKLALRVAALQLMSEAFLSIRKEGEAPAEDFVKVETPASKQRDAAAAQGKTAPAAPPRPPTTSEKTPVAAPAVPPHPAPQPAAPSAAAPRPAAPSAPPRPAASVPPPPVSTETRPSPAAPAAAATTAEEKEKEETLKAAYQAYESKRRHHMPGEASAAPAPGMPFM